MSSPVRSFSPARDDRGPRAVGLRPIRRVLINYESSAHGRAALFHGLGIARRAAAPVTVVSIAVKEPVSGCGLCRQNAVFWNRERRSLAEEDLAEAANLVDGSPAVEYAVAVGRPVQALGEAADRSAADVIVLPWEPNGRLRRLLSPTVAERLRKAGRFKVIVAPAGTPQSRVGSRTGAGAVGPERA